jgi:formylglycine-generating enzyme required for sulfatase activity
VGQKRPNDFGLFDMLGNVFQWCQESAQPYQPAPGGRAADDLEDTKDITWTLPRLVRGGAFHAQARIARSATRYVEGPTYQLVSFGLRPVRTYR